MLGNYLRLNTLVDAHCHLHEFTNSELLNLCGVSNLQIIAVSDDYKTSLRTLELGVKCSNVIPSVGLHPWNIGRVDVNYELNSLMEVISRVKFLGEVGLDRRFTPSTFEEQLAVFRRFTELAAERNLGMNVHAAGAWDEVLKILGNYNIRVAIIHWYTGPEELLKDVESWGYFITVNPAVKVQEKLRRVVSKAPLEIILTESDGPYSYRGLRLEPKLIPEAIYEISRIKGYELEHVYKAIYENFTRLRGKLGI